MVSFVYRAAVLLAAAVSLHRLTVDRLPLNLVAFAANQSQTSSQAPGKQTISVAMRDGVKLATDFYRSSESAKAPVLLTRTPYNKDNVRPVAEKYAAAGYNVIVQDTRGRYKSEGAFYAYNNEGQDGYDTLEWIQRQPWSDGRVGMWGASYVGAVQWQAAAEKAPGLAVLTPTATWGSFFNNVYLGGAVRLALIAQAAASLDPRPAQVAAGPIDWPRVLFHLPLSTLDMAIGWSMPWLTGILTHNRPDGYWDRLDVRRQISELNLPAQHVVGYYDFFCREVVANFERLRNRAPQQLIIGPWDHGTIGKTRVGDVDFGPAALLDLAEENVAWFNRFLKSSGTAFPPVRYFSMGDNTWRQADNWPPSNSRATWYYLHSGGDANGSRGAGKLNREPPGSESADVFDSDPANPTPSVPSRAGRGEYEAIWGPVDQSPIDDRRDVLVYSTTALSRPLRFAGPLKAEIAVSANTPDADWVVKIADVRPDGFAQNLATGIRRGSFRESDSIPTPLIAGKTYNIQVDLGHAAATIAPGHKLRVEIAGSCFPLFDRNTNTGEGPGGARTLIARQRVEHSAKAVSRVLLQVIEE